MKTPATIRIAIADDHTVMRSGLAELIRTLGDFEITMQVSNGAILLEELSRAEELPDICILDINMPELNGYDTTVQLKALYPELPVLALSMYENEFSIVKMLRCGAKGFLHKGADPEELMQAIKTVHSGSYFHSEMMLINTIRRSGGSQSMNITDRETEFLEHCCSDLSYKEIAVKMGVSLHTVHGYRDTLFSKLRLKSRTALAVYALKKGVVTD